MEIRSYYFSSTEPNITTFLAVKYYFEINNDNWMNFLEISLDDVNERVKFTETRVADNRKNHYYIMKKCCLM